MSDVGKVVVPDDPFRWPLHSGASLYDYAICVSEDPFVIVSPEGDMMWTKRERSSLKVLCRARWIDSRKAFKRWRRENK